MIARTIALLAAASFPFAVAAFGQQPPAASQSRTPAVGASAAITSPEVTADGRVTFRLAAPNATAVSLVCECLSADRPMTKDAVGVWTVTLSGVNPDIYEYHFNVDGFEMLDPRNIAVKYNSRPNLIESLVEVPGAAPMFYDIRPVQHGKVDIRYYSSKTTGTTRRVFIYTPPGYDKSTAKLPVLYLLHGADGDETMWVNFGRANLILDNLIADKKAAPMIVVMPFGYAHPPTAGTSAQTQREDFEKDLLGDLIPFVQANYRAAADREHRALAGLSMGGGQTLAIGPRHLETFSRLGVFSAGAGANPEASLKDVAANAKAVNAQLKLFWMGIGTEDPGFAGAKRTSDFLTSAGIKHGFTTVPGAHTWIVWRRFLNEVAPQLWSATSPTN